MHPILAGAAESMKASITIVKHFQKKKKWLMKKLNGVSDKVLKYNKKRYFI